MITEPAGVETGVYLFCLAGPGAQGIALEGTGIDGQHPIAIRSMHEVVAVVSETALAEFAGPEAEARMRDVEWLAPRVLLHEHVVEAVAARAPVLPARLGTIFSSEQRLAALIARHKGTIAGFFDHVAGHEEWAVKGHLDRGRALEARVKDALASVALSQASGTRYMQERRARAHAEAELQAWLQQAARRIWDAISALASDAVERAVLPPGGEQPEGEMVFNWALLVPVARVSELHAVVARLDDELAATGLTLHESGAWPPFSFAPALDEPR